MKIKHTKTIIDSMHRCYSVSQLKFQGEKAYAVASEAINGVAKLYYGPDYQDTIELWEDRGGTMSIVPIPGAEGTQFLAIQNFFPGFNARDVKIVRLAHEGGHWLETDVINIPYCHRFELVTWNNEIYIVAATLCTWKNEREDWSSPGHVFVGKYQPETNEVTDLKLVIPNLVQNHGMLKVTSAEVDEDFVLISTYEGVFKLYFDSESETYTYQQLLETPSSETVIIDIDGDGEDEYIAIQPFHGNELGVYRADGSLQTIIKRNTNFLHSLWSGYVEGKPFYLCGGRRIDSDIYLGYWNQETEAFEEYLIDSGNGSANIVVSVEGNKMEIISTNNSLDEIAIYHLTFEEIA